MSINSYLIQKKIGTGNFSTVFKAHRHESTERKYAIKILSANPTNQEKELAFKQINILNKIKHLNIIQLYEHFNINQATYMVMEFCGQGDLQVLFKKKKVFSQQLTVLIAIKMVNALQELEKYKIAHRDIKLANILVNDDFEIKLADLGFAKAMTEEKLLQSYAGTPLNMAPEIFQHKQYTNKCDVWSFGVVLYQMLHGCFPFYPKQGGIQQLIDMVSNQPINFLKLKSPLSNQCVDFIRKCMEKKPQNRISPSDMQKHPWIVNGNQAKRSINQLLNQNYRESSIFYIEGDEEYLTKENIQIQTMEWIKKGIRNFFNEYQKYLQNIKRVLLDIEKLNPRNKFELQYTQSIHQLVNKKISSIQKQSIKVLIAQSEFKLFYSQINKNCQNSLNTLKKMIKVVNFKEVINLNFYEQSANLYAQANEEINQARRLDIFNIIKRSIEIAMIQFNNVMHKMELKSNLNVKYKQTVISIFSKFTKEDVIKLFNQKPDSKFIHLIEPLQFQNQFTKEQNISINIFLDQLEISR